MQFATFANGAKMPMAGFGCWKVPADVCADTIYGAIKAGCRMFDCASDYGNEELVGQGFKRAFDEGLVKREDLFVVSKLWNTFHKPEHVREGMEKSLKDLGLDYLDLYLVHFPIALKYVPIEKRYPGGWFEDPDAENPRMVPETGVTYQQTWEAMEELVLAKDGKVKNIGVCNLSTVMMWQLLNYARVKPAVLQVELHPRNTQERLLRLCREQNVTVMAFSSFGPSSYVELGMADADASLLFDETIKAVAAEVNRTAGQVLLRWAVQRGTIVIPKTSKPERLVENMSLFDFELTADQMTRIDKLNTNTRYNDPGHFCEKAFNCFYPIYQ